MQITPVQIIGFNRIEDRQKADRLTPNELRSQSFDWLIHHSYLDIEADTAKEAVDLLVDWFSTPAEPNLIHYLNGRFAPIAIRITWNDGQQQLLKILLGLMPGLFFVCLGPKDMKEMHVWCTSHSRSWTSLVQQLELAIRDPKLEVYLHTEPTDEMIAYLRLMGMGHYELNPTRMLWRVGPQPLPVDEELKSWPLLPNM